MKTVTVKTSHTFYNTCLNNFRKQFKDIVRMNKVYINEDKKVFAGEWVDSRGVINFNSGYLIDAVKQITFKD